MGRYIYLCWCSVGQLCPAVCDPMDYSPPGSSVHGISQARVLGWVAIFFFRGSSRPRDWICVFCIGRQILYAEPPGKPQICLSVQFSSVQSLSHVRLFATPWIAACQASLPITNSQSSLKLTSIESMMPSSHLCRPEMPSSYPLLSPSPAPNPSQHQGLFQWVNSSHEVGKVLEFQLQHHSFQWTPRADLLQNGLVGSPCGPRDSQESSPTPQFKSINSSALSFLHSPTLTSIHDHWKNHSLD